VDKINNRHRTPKAESALTPSAFSYLPLIFAQNAVKAKGRFFYSIIKRHKNQNAEGMQMENVSKESCAERHKAVDEKIKRHERWLGEHEVKIDTLIKSDAVNSTEIKNLCKSISSQTKAIWGLVSLAAAALLGFFIWYVQSLPRGG
jgi:hypothetical protein